jgi:hypothetical protein
MFEQSAGSSAMLQQRRSYRRICALLALALVAMATAASAQTTALVVRSEPGESIGGGQSLTYTTADTSFSVTRNALNGVSAVVTHAGVQWILHFAAPGGNPLALGNYPTARRYGTTIAAGLLMTRGPSFCGSVRGHYLVREIEYATNGNVLRFAIDAEQACIGPLAVGVALRYNSTIPTDMFPGTDRYSLTVAPPAHGIVIGAGLAAGLACGGTRLACAVTFTGPYQATLMAIPDAGYMLAGWSGGCSGGPLTSILVSSAEECGATFQPIESTTPRTLLILNSPTNEGIGNGRTYIYGAENSQWQFTPLPGNGVFLTVRGIGPQTDAFWLLEIKAPPFTGDLGIGSYFYPSLSWSGHSSPGLAISPEDDGTARGSFCFSSSARLDVRRLEFDARSGAVTAFAADFEQSCSTRTPPMTGTIEYRVPSDIPCTTRDPFASIGGGFCYKGGWIPTNMHFPAARVNAQPPHRLRRPGARHPTRSCRSAAARVETAVGYRLACSSPL